MDMRNEAKDGQVDVINLGTEFKGVKGENGEKNSIKVVGGQLVFPILNAELFKDPASYARRKVLIWHRMITEGQRPCKWFKATKKGTKVNFDYMYEQQDVEAAIKDFEAYIEEVNREYKLGFVKRES